MEENLGAFLTFTLFLHLQHNTIRKGLCKYLIRPNNLVQDACKNESATSSKRLVETAQLLERVDRTRVQGLQCFLMARLLMS